jgi:3-oxoacyl-(acyl-carrier-protein) synthase
MSVHIAGTGWVTPLGSETGEVWSRLLAEDSPPADEISDPLGKNSYPAYRVPQVALKNMPPHPRLRRASAISRFAAAAGLTALAEAKLTLDDTLSGRLALVFAVANGGVIYTKRFYSDVVNTGANTASPLLFPETVFNAPASHLAAIMGLSGTTYTVVGDGSVGLVGMKMGEDLMADPNLDYCLIVAAEEADWLLCDAYAKWRLLRSKPPVELFGQGKGTILSEGASAVLLSRTGPVRVAGIAAGSHFKHRRDTPAALAEALKSVGAPRNATVIGSANGTFVDAAEADALNQISPEGTIYSLKAALGEGVAASSLWQVIAAVRALRTGEIPRPQYLGRSRAAPGSSETKSDLKEMTVLCCGLNQQLGAARLLTTS